MTKSPDTPTTQHLAVITISEWSSLGGVEEVRFEPTEQNIRQAAAWFHAIAPKFRGFAVTIRIACTDEHKTGRIVTEIEKVWRPTSVQINVPGGSLGLPSALKHLYGKA